MEIPIVKPNRTYRTRRDDKLEDVDSSTALDPLETLLGPSSLILSRGDNNVMCSNHFDDTHVSIY